MIVVSDTSPILNLSIICQLDPLQKLFVELVLPPSVAEELAKHQIAVQPQWMLVVAAQPFAIGRSNPAAT